MEGRCQFHSDFAIPRLIEKDAEKLSSEQCIDWLAYSTDRTVPGE